MSAASSSPPSSTAAGVSESKADLVSIEVSEAGAPHQHSGVGVGGGMFPLSKRHWTSLERLLLGLVAVMAAVVVAVVVVATTRKSDLDNVCNTSACIGAAHALLQNMDSRVDPCQDFYQYACGGFEKRIRIPDDRTTRSQFALIDDELEEQLRDILESDELARRYKIQMEHRYMFQLLQGSGSPVFRLARDQYHACMDLDRLESVGLDPLREILRRFGGWPVVEGDQWDEDKFNWQELIYLFRANGYSTDYLLDFSIGTDIKNSTARVIYFDQPHLGMSREYLIKGLEDEDVRHYYTYMQKIAVLLGADAGRAAEELRRSLDLEIELAKSSLPREQRRDATKLYHPMKLSEMAGNVSDLVDWTEYVNRVLTEDVMQVTPDERVVVSTPQYLRNLTTILGETPKKDVANYMLWRAARASIGFLNKEIREIGEEFAKNVTGRTAVPPRWKKCVGSAAGSFSAAIGKMYVREHFDNEAKAAMLEMVADIRHEFKIILDEITWMDPLTKKRAHEKLSSIKEYIGYPEEILVDANLEELYKGLQVNATHYFHNSINMSVWSTNYHWRKLREPVDKTDWKRHANPAVVNAFYSSIENSIQFPAGILQGIFFGKDRPAYTNYGGIGWVIGHEITHGFDDQGRQFDAEGNLANWWEPETVKRFVDKTQCVIHQYGNYTAKPVNMSLNGINTQGENIADNERWTERHGREKVLPGIDLNQDQLFWLSAANTWCSKYRDKALEQRIKTGSHSPSMFRVQGPFSNSREFARDFHCPAGSGMNPEKKCEVW